MNSARVRFTTITMKPTALPKASPGRLLMAGLMAFVPLGLLQAADPAATTVKVVPAESQELLSNPGMGWQTFHRFADDDPNLQGLPSTSAYFRFYWREIEPHDGQIDFARFDDLLARARRAGQKLAFRVMCTGSGAFMDVPAWLKEQGCAGIDFRYGNGEHWVPDFADPRFQEKHLRLIRELGRRYDGHADLDLVDIGSVGLWGEWHMSGTQVLGSDRPVPLPSREILDGLISAWRDAFPRTPKVVLIGSEEGMRRTVKDGLGWRADCLGDMGGFSKTWNHMDDFYLQQLARTGAEEAWKTGPVAFESCWDMRKWKEAGWDIRYIFDYALRCHGSYVNNKSAPLPEGARSEVERLLRRIGYRLVLREVLHPARLKPGDDAQVTLQWENIGVAPPYLDARVALRLRPTSGAGEPNVLVATASIRGWQPGPHRIEVPLPVSAGLRAGRHELAVGIVDPQSHQPAVRLAVVGRDPEGWYPVSHVEVAP